jgi:hypothetical protein
MHQRISQCSRRLNNIALARRQRQLAAHLQYLEARCVQANKPCRSLRLHAQGNLGYPYIIFGEEGYADPRGELPSFGFRAVWEGQGHLQGRKGGEGATTTNIQGDKRSQRDDLVTVHRKPTTAQGASRTQVAGSCHPTWSQGTKEGRT